MREAMLHLIFAFKHQVTEHWALQCTVHRDDAWTRASTCGFLPPATMDQPTKSTIPRSPRTRNAHTYQTAANWSHSHLGSGVAMILQCGHRSWATKTRESRRRSRRDGAPSQTDLGASWAPPAGSGAETRRQRIFGIFEAHRTLLVERTVLKPQTLRPNNNASFSVKNLIDDWGRGSPL